MPDSINTEIIELNPQQNTKEQFLAKLSTTNKSALQDMLTVADSLMTTDNLTGGFYVDPIDFETATAEKIRIHAFIDDSERIGMSERRMLGRSLIPLKSILGDVSHQVPGIKIETTTDPAEKTGGGIVLKLNGNTTVEIVNTTRTSAETIQEDGKENIDLLNKGSRNIQQVA